MDNLDPFSLEKKNILVTGASSGIGRCIAIECSKRGAHLIITGRNEERLNETFSLLKQDGHLKIVADLSNDSEIEYLCEGVPKLEGIVHVAGIVKPKPFSFLNRSDLEETLNINFLSPAILTNRLLKRKIFNKPASIVFISSISGTLCSFVGGTSYSSSKGAINGLIKGMALDLAPRQIRINSIIPGMIETGIFNNSSISEQDLLDDRKKYPLGRYGKPEDVAYAAIYLLSDASSWVTGSNLLIDGGFTLL